MDNRLTNMKNKFTIIGIILTTIVLAGIAIFTAIRLYQTRNVAPTSSEAAAGACQLSFTITSQTPTATATATGIRTATPTATPTATATATATARAVECNQECNTSINPPISCEAEMSCYTTSTLRGASGVCRNLDCVEETDCGCPGATATPTVTPTKTPTATATATTNPQCNNSCTQNTDCPDGLMCNIPSGETSGSCRNTSCLSETDCLCPQPTSTATSTYIADIAEQPELPSVGTTWPTIVGTAFGILVILGSLLLAF